MGLVSHLGCFTSEEFGGQLRGNWLISLELRLQLPCVYFLAHLTPVFACYPLLASLPNPGGLACLLPTVDIFWIFCYVVSVSSNRGSFGKQVFESQ